MALSPRGTWEAALACRERSPLIQCITNFVSMDLMANVVLAIGASPAMASSLSEVEEFVSIASALVVNIGTLWENWGASMRLAARRAVDLGKPWVLDPVGCGSTSPRTRLCAELLAIGPTVVRGNASEILALAGRQGRAGKGVDSTAGAEEAVEAAKEIARASGAVVAVSGATDYVTDGRRVLAVRTGRALLQQITATGCSVTAVIVAFVAAGERSRALENTAHALAYFGLCAQLGDAGEARGPGSLRVALLDNLYCAREEDVLRLAHVEEVAEESLGAQA